ncbi:uncharacterized protein [Penaeus vannamei]|uniref:uncharacterized protein n=1 Tax=Penaeus vannamei TaxID=6689 RepID=UPI00387FAFD2
MAIKVTDVSWTKSKIQDYGGLLGEPVQSIRASGVDAEVRALYTLVVQFMSLGCQTRKSVDGLAWQQEPWRCRLINNNVHKKMVKVDNIHTNNTCKKFSRQGKQSSDAENFTSPLQTLKNDETITITKPDKGPGVVILNKHDYLQKLLSILDDHTKFKKITAKISSHLLYLEDKLKRLLRAIKPSIGESTYNFLSTSGSQPGMLYGLPKVHRPNIPLRPIISSIGTFNYKTAKFLVPLISPLTTNKYTIENSTAFANEITSLGLQQPITMASFDVESLFTNVPLLETRDYS